MAYGNFLKYFKIQQYTYMATIQNFGIIYKITDIENVKNQIVVINDNLHNKSNFLPMYICSIINHIVENLCQKNTRSRNYWKKLLLIKKVF